VPEQHSIAGDVPGVTSTWSGDTLYVIGPRVVLGDRLAQLADAETMRVARAAVLSAFSRAVAHHRRRLEVRLAVLEMHDIDSARSKVPARSADLDGEKRLDLADATRDARLQRRRSSRATRSRAVMICHIIRVRP